MSKYVFIALLIVSNSISLDVFVLHHNYTCLYDTHAEMECFANSEITPVQFHAPELPEPIGTNVWWMYFGIITALILCSALMSALSISFMTLDQSAMKNLAEEGTDDERKYASRILPLITNKHLLLATLLLGNVIANETMPIFLEKLLPTYAAIILAVALIIFFGELVPFAIGARFGLVMGYYFVWITWMIVGLFWVITWPISKLLDFIVEEDTQIFLRRQELGELVKTTWGRTNCCRR